MQFYMPTLIILHKQHFCFSVHFFKQAPENLVTCQELLEAMKQGIA